jgi:glycosyltransferase involved in cell wall biosynthesis
MDGLLQTLSVVSDLSFEILVVDDGNGDETAAVVLERASRHPSNRLLRRGAHRMSAPWAAKILSTASLSRMSVSWWRYEGKAASSSRRRKPVDAAAAKKRARASLSIPTTSNPSLGKDLDRGGAHQAGRARHQRDLHDLDENFPAWP